MSALELLNGLLCQLRYNDLVSFDKELLIEALKKAATGLKISEEQIDFAEIINHICDGIYITDGVGRTLYTVCWRWPSYGSSDRRYRII